MHIRPIGSHVLIRRLKGERISNLAGNVILPESAIHIPDSWLAKSFRGQVVATGRGQLTTMGHLIAPKVEVGDMVWIAVDAGSEIKVNNETLLIVCEDDILGVENG